MKLDELNQASAADFTARLAALYEHSPWVPARAAERRPFASAAALSAALAAVVAAAHADEQLALVRAHPDLAGKLARAGRLEPASSSEQAGLELDRLSDEEFEHFDALNTAYRERFGFPFVIAVRQHTRASVLAAFATRLTHDAPDELNAALAEINTIARLRLAAMLAA